MATFLNVCLAGWALPGVISAVFPWQLYFKKDARILTSEQRSALETKVKEFAAILKIKKNFFVFPGLIGSIVGVVATVFFSRWCEEWADKIGFSMCSKEEKDLTIEFFKMQSILNGWDNPEDLLHPSLTTRINYLEALNNL
jgi:hypothetical protein